MKADVRIVDCLPPYRWERDRGVRLHAGWILAGIVTAALLAKLFE